MASIFSRIIAGEIPCYIVAENDLFLAFLDIAPLCEGHVLVVPKVEVDNAFDLNKDILAAWLVFAQPIAKAIESSFTCNRCGVSIIGLEVPHAHMHLVPINTADDLNFTRPKLKVASERMQQIQSLIVSNIR